MLEHTGSAAVMATLVDFIVRADRAAALDRWRCSLDRGLAGGDHAAASNMLRGLRRVRGGVVGSRRPAPALALVLSTSSLAWSTPSSSPPTARRCRSWCASRISPSANALSSISTQLGRVAGPPLGAAIVAVGGPTLAFVLNGLTFLIAAALLVPLLHQARALSVGTARTSLLDCHVRELHHRVSEPSALPRKAHSSVASASLW